MVRRLAFVGSPDTTVATPESPPRGVVFAPPRPNPTRDAVQFTWTLPISSDVTLEILDLGSRFIRRLEHSSDGPGTRVATWDGRDKEGRRAPAGLYLARLRAAGVSQARRMVLAR